MLENQKSVFGVQGCSSGKKEQEFSCWIRRAGGRLFSWIRAAIARVRRAARKNGQLGKERGHSQGPNYLKGGKGPKGLVARPLGKGAPPDEEGEGRSLEGPGRARWEGAKGDGENLAGGAWSRALERGVGDGEELGL